MVPEMYLQLLRVDDFNAHTRAWLGPVSAFLLVWFRGQTLSFPLRVVDEASGDITLEEVLGRLQTVVFPLTGRPSRLRMPHRGGI